MFTGLFDYENRLAKLDKNNDPLVPLKSLVPWEMFREDLERIRKSDYKKGGRKPYDVILMFKILILQSLYNLSDDVMEFQINDRLSFMRFLDLGLGDKVPDSKTIWVFREKLKEDSLSEVLFSRFEMFLCSEGYEARGGQIVDACIVQVPIQRNKRDENKDIKAGKVPEDWDKNKKSQKDTDARWTKKNGKSYYGYKNHISIDKTSKLIRRYKVTSANEHDVNHFVELLDDNNSSKAVYADSAYSSAGNIKKIEDLGYIDKTIKKAARNKELSKNTKKSNRRRSSRRARVEHVFGAIRVKAKDVTIRVIGKARFDVAISLRNLSYNINRYCCLRG